MLINQKIDQQNQFPFILIVNVLRAIESIESIESIASIKTC